MHCVLGVTEEIETNNITNTNYNPAINTNTCNTACTSLSSNNNNLPASTNNNTITIKKELTKNNC